MPRNTPCPIRLAASAVVAAGIWAAPARAGFVTDTFVVLEVGDGTTAVPFNSSNLAQAVSLNVYSTRTGAKVGSYAMPSVGASQVVLSSRNDDHDGHVNLSPDGQYLTFGGYRAAPGSAYPAAQSAASVPRVAVRVGGNFVPNTATTFGGGYSGTTAVPVTLTAVASKDGGQFWGVGGNETTGTGGLRYVSALGGTTSANVSKTQTGSAADSFRNARIVRTGGVDTLYANTASQGSFVNRGAYAMTIGGGLPAGADGTSSTVTPVIVNKEGSLTDAAGNADPDGKGKFHPKSDAVFVDADGNGSRETAYSTGGKEELEKWAFNGTAWTRSGLIFLASGQEINALDYGVEDGKLSLFISTDIGVYKLLDAGGTGGIVSPQVAAPDFENKKYFTDALFVSPDANTVFRGLAVVPEPASAGMLGVAAAGLLARRRRRRA